MALAERTCDGFESESPMPPREPGRRKEWPLSITNKMAQDEKWEASALVLPLNADTSLCHTPMAWQHTHMLRSSPGAGGVPHPRLVLCAGFSCKLLQLSASAARDFGGSKSGKERDRRWGGREEKRRAKTLTNTLLHKQTHLLFSRNILWLDSCNLCRDRQHPVLRGSLLSVLTHSGGTMPWSSHHNLP